VGVALVASAAKSLTHSTCKNKITLAINATTAAIVCYYNPTWVFPLLLISGGLVTLLSSRDHDTPARHSEDCTDSFGIGTGLGSALVLIWILLLAASVFILEGTPYALYQVFHWWGTFFKIGSLIFGGGQVNSNTTCSAPLLPVA